MKIAVIADVQPENRSLFAGKLEGGLNERFLEAVDVLEQACSMASEREADRLVVCGDLFDRPDPEPWMVERVEHALLAFTSGHIYIILGNHDRASTNRDHHACASIDQGDGFISIIEETTHSLVGNEWLGFVPWEPRSPSEVLDEIRTTCSEAPEGSGAASRSLYLHQGIADADTPDYMRGDAVDVDDLASICREFGIEAVFAGDWHVHAVVNANPLVVRVGALVPRGFQDAGLEGYGSLLFYDTNDGTMERVEVPGPRFINLTEDVLRGSHDLGTPEKAAPLRARLKVPGSRLEEAKRWADEQSFEVDVVPDKDSARNQARSGAALARASETVEEGIHDYVGEIEVPDEVDREEVARRAMEYLSRTGAE